MNLTLFIISSLVAFIILFLIQNIRDSKKHSDSLPKCGSRWRYRNHDGEVYKVFRILKKLAFIHDDGFIEMAPIEYFMTVAKPLPARNE